ncbi:MAG: CPBP family intramembrane metalloprotease [Acidobacteria bacterium]|nr:CPBP family intramembrane metalloprotease [Acidobacteriota bacterium]
MDLTCYFLLPDGRLRAGWRLALFVVFFLLAWVVFSGVASLEWEEPTIASQIAIFAAAALTATAGSMRLLEHQPFVQVGLVLERRSRSELGLGLVGGIILVSTTSLVAWGVGVIQFQASGTDAASAARLFLPVTFLFMVSATTEELLFRGYPFQRLVEGSNGWVAIAIFSFLFGYLHAGNPHVTRLSVANTIIAGILLSLAYLKTRALWLPIGFHFSWNWMLSLLGQPVSGLMMAPMPWKVVASPEYDWLHGGDYGPEGGLLATIVLSVGIAGLARWKRKIHENPPETTPPV